MTGLTVRVSEEATRPLGQAIITVTGLPPTLRTLEFALSRRGYAANHLGPDGWQGAEHWLHPEEAWFSGDALKFVLGPDSVYQLENMPYELALRGEGLPDIARIAFIWPLELDIEEAGGGEQRQWLGGTRVDSQPRSTPSITAAAGMGPASLQPPPLDAADIPIPDVVIPDYATPTPAPAAATPSLVRAMETTATHPERPPPLPTVAPAPSTPAQTMDQDVTVERPVTPPPLPANTASVATPASSDDTRPIPALRREAVSEPEQPLAIDTSPPKQRSGWVAITALIAGLAVLGALAGWWLWNTYGQQFVSSGDKMTRPAARSTPDPATTPPSARETPTVVDTEPRPAEEARPSSPTPRVSTPTPQSPTEPGTASVPAATRPLVPSTPATPPASPVESPATVSAPPPRAEPEAAPASRREPVPPSVSAPLAGALPEPPTMTRNAPPAPAVSEPRTLPEPSSTAVEPTAPGAGSPLGKTPAPGADVASELEKRLRPKADLEKELESQLGKSKADIQSELEKALEQKPTP
jgi:cytoskeletal protein RodZ